MGIVFIHSACRKHEKLAVFGRVLHEGKEK